MPNLEGKKDSACLFDNLLPSNLLNGEDLGSREIHMKTNVPQHTDTAQNAINYDCRCVSYAYCGEDEVEKMSLVGPTFF
ncbi:hypothetical protein V6N12_076209 [Hibiscus sabdariffa]|uniref:Uncharacterized protein n=1 Tax=Hibiscus sabdariffa TaxID=183260 RepID=A0ABR2B275_9ROSI